MIINEKLGVSRLISEKVKGVDRIIIIISNRPDLGVDKNDLRRRQRDH